MASRRPTRSDVAKLAKVAPSTVTLVLNEKGSDVGISAATQERIREAARSLGYYPNFHISSVLRGRSNLIGLYLRADQWASPVGYWTTIVWQLQRAVANTELGLVIHNARYGCSTEEAFARQAGGVVDGVIILNSGDDPIVSRLMEAGLPAVELGDRFSPLPYVAVDGEDGVRQVLSMLNGSGRRAPACLDWNTTYSKNSNSRIEVFVEESNALNPGLDFAGRVVHVNWDDDPVERLLALDPRPDAIVCLSDEHAYQCLAGLEKRGYRVPDDIAITGFDALPLLGGGRKVTSVLTPLQASAERALAKLEAVVAGTPYVQEEVLPVSIRLGETT